MTLGYSGVEHLTGESVTANSNCLVSVGEEVYNSFAECSILSLTRTNCMICATI